MDEAAREAAGVAAAAGRMLAWIDADPLSPTRGCADLGHWRDKTSEHADARRQEVMFALALLHERDYPGCALRGDPRLLAAVRDLLRFWAVSQYSDGSLDEWYKGERAYAAGAFTVHAVARTLDLCGPRLAASDLAAARAALGRTAHWLAARSDLFKANHQAVGVAALAWAGHVLGEERFRETARRKLAALVAVQTSEGWFPEVGGADPGYAFLTVEYAVAGMDRLGDWTHLPAFLRALHFACLWLDPDLRLAPEFGICRNPYVSRLAFALLAGRDPLASELAGRWCAGRERSAALDPLLADDLRLARWAFQPLLAYDASRTIRPAAGGGSPGATVCPEAGLARLVDGEREAIFASCSGGMVRAFDRTGRAQSDYGYAVAVGSFEAGNRTYDRALPLTAVPGGFATEAPIRAVRAFLPSFAARLLLRLACTTAWGSRAARRGIDWIRRRKATAVNQSSGARGGRTLGVLRRRFTLDGEARIEDELEFSEPVAFERIRHLVSSGTDAPRTEPVFPGRSGAARRFRVRRVLGPDGWTTAAVEEAS